MARAAPGPWSVRLGALAVGACVTACLTACLTACGGGSGTTDADAGRAPAPPPTRFWLQDVQLEPLVDGGAAPPEVHLPVHVELWPDGVVRSLPGAERAIEGRLPAKLLKEPADRRGLMLYAQRLVELHHGKPDGLVIGRLYPGAFASVAPAGDASWLVAVPRHGFASALLAYVAKDALGDTKLPEPAETVPGDTHFDFAIDVPFGIAVPGDGPQGQLQLLCGGLRVDDRIRQYYRGVEIDVSHDDARRLRGLGFVEGQPERGPTPCPSRHVHRGRHGLFVHSGRDVLDRTDVDAIPPGYVAVAKSDKDPIREAFERRSAVYWLSGTSGKLACEEWRFLRRNGPGRSATLALERTGVRKDGWYAVELPEVGKEPDAGWSLSLRGPRTGETGYGCEETFGLLRVDADRMYLESFPRVLSSPSEEVVAFEPDEVEQWFLTREACESVLRTAPPTRDSLAPGLRRPCYRNIQRGDTGYW